MIRTRFVVLIIALSALVTTGAALTASIDPEIVAVAPNPAAPTTSPQSIAITGRGFLEHLTLSITGPSGAVQHYSEQTITYQRDTAFQAMVTLAAAGSYRLVVTNPDGKASTPFILSVKSPATTPSITAIEPQAIVKSTNPQNLTVLGAQFVPGLSAMVTDPAGNVVTISRDGVGTVSPTSVTITVTLELAGSYSLVITNPSGAVSNPFDFKVGGQRKE
jgi:hypothetical protein